MERPVDSCPPLCRGHAAAFPASPFSISDVSEYRDPLEGSNGARPWIGSSSIQTASCRTVRCALTSGVLSAPCSGGLQDIARLCSHIAVSPAGGWQLPPAHGHVSGLWRVCAALRSQTSFATYGEGIHDSSSSSLRILSRLAWIFSSYLRILSLLPFPFEKESHADRILVVVSASPLSWILRIVGWKLISLRDYGRDL